jgi:Holliday junction resolvase RusA-like endonuclease
LITIDFCGHIPSKKNSKVKTKWGAVIPSKAYREWHKEQMPMLQKYRSIPSPVTIEYKFWIGGKVSPGRFDLSNAIESINDILVDAEILSDDAFDHLCNGGFSVEGFVRGESIARVTIAPVERRWVEPLRILRDKEAIVAFAKEKRVTQKKAIDLLWQEMGAIEFERMVYLGSAVEQSGSSSGS